MDIFQLEGEGSEQVEGEATKDEATMTVANVEMAAAWDGPEGEHWAQHADRYERSSWRHCARFLEAVRIEPDDDVLDNGCGTEKSTRDVPRMATSGSAVEVDEPVELGADAEHAFAFVGTFGITKGLTQDLDEEQRARAFDALRRTIADHETDDGVLFGSAAWLVTARVPRRST